MSSEKPGGWLRFGCAALALIALTAVILAGVAVMQNRSVEVESSSLEIPVVERSLELSLVVQVAQVTLIPGERFAVDAQFDPRDYVLEQSGGGDRHEIGLRPAGSVNWALFRAKVGREIPHLRIVVPREVELRISGSIEKGFAAVELGDTSLRQLDLQVEDGATTVSFSVPTKGRAESVELWGHRTSLELTGLGHASPEVFSIGQRLGAVDLDFRGQWRGDADISVDVGMAGGMIWLPDSEQVLMLSPNELIADGPEIDSRPQLRLDLPATKNVIRIGAD